MAEDDTTDGLKNWGGGGKSARPDSVGPHHRKQDQEDPAAPGLSPEHDYDTGPGEQAGTAGPGTPGEMKVNIGVKPDDGSKAEGGAERDAPPLTGLASE